MSFYNSHKSLFYTTSTILYKLELSSFAHLFHFLSYVMLYLAIREQYIDESLQLEIVKQKTQIFYKRPTKVGGNDAGVLL